MNEAMISMIDSKEINSEELDLFADEVDVRGNAIGAGAVAASCVSCISTAASVSTSACMG